MIRFSKRRGGREGLFALPVSPPRPRPAARRRAGLGELTEPVQLPVLAVQQQLRRAGYNVGRLDGRWGPTTENAFKRFLTRIGYVRREQLPLEIDYEHQLASIEVAIWNRLTSSPAGAGGETTSSGSSSSSGSGSGSGSSSGGSGSSRSSGSGGRTTTSTSSPTNSNARSGATDEDGAWWQSPWLWGAVALAAGASVVFIATREPEPEEDDELEDEELLPAF